MITLMTSLLTGGGPTILSRVLSLLLLSTFAFSGVRNAVPRRESAQAGGAADLSPGPAYDSTGHFLLPADYREWIFLSSGIGMVYGPKASAGKPSFDNVFASPAAYRSFVEHGTWPDKTMLILEVRGADTNPSINHGGHSQSATRTAVEVHLKDTSRFAGGWAFFDVDAAGRGSLLPTTAECYSCHREHAAVDTTFVQFYPTLLPISEAKGTLSEAYRREFPAAASGR